MTPNRRHRHHPTSCNPNSTAKLHTPQALPTILPPRPMPTDTQPSALDTFPTDTTTVNPRRIFSPNTYQPPSTPNHAHSLSRLLLSQNQFCPKSVLIVTQLPKALQASTSLTMAPPPARHNRPPHQGPHHIPISTLTPLPNKNKNKKNKPKPTAFDHFNKTLLAKSKPKPQPESPPHLHRAPTPTTPPTTTTPTPPAVPTPTPTGVSTNPPFPNPSKTPKSTNPPSTNPYKTPKHAKKPYTPPPPHQSVFVPQHQPLHRHPHRHDHLECIHSP